MAPRQEQRERKRSPRFGDSVFINCPFDADYWPILEAVVFCVVDCGFVARSALDAVDSGEARVQKIMRLIRTSKYAIHDLSRVELSEANGLPRFNMPFELGLDLGARHFGRGVLKSKCCLVLDAHAYTYQKTLSDIAGQDPAYHHNSAAHAIAAVRRWLRSASGRTTIPGDLTISRRFAEFSAQISEGAARAGLDRANLSFVDYVHLAVDWLSAAASPVRRN